MFQRNPIWDISGPQKAEAFILLFRQNPPVTRSVAKVARRILPAGEVDSRSARRARHTAARAFHSKEILVGDALSVKSRALPPGLTVSLKFAQSNRYTMFAVRPLNPPWAPWRWLLANSSKAGPRLKTGFCAVQ